MKGCLAKQLQIPPFKGGHVPKSFILLSTKNLDIGFATPVIPPMLHPRG